MKRKSIAALALAAIMTLGVGSTFAWFTSATTSLNNAVKTGTLVIGAPGASAVRSFTLSNLYPGIEGSKSDYVTLKNNGSINLQYNVSSTFISGEGNLYNIADVKVTKTSGDPVYNGKLSNLNSALANTTLPVGKSETLNFTVSLPDATGNEYQNKAAVVNFVFNAEQNLNTSEWTGGGEYGTVTANVVAGVRNGTFNLQGAPYSKAFSNTASDWSGSYYAETDIFLNPLMDNGKGFDYSVAMKNADGSFLRDFIFHVAKDSSTQKLLVGASNNSNFKIREDLDTTFTNNQITEAGWYTFQHRFYRVEGGKLAADLSILDANKKVVYTQTINTTDVTLCSPTYSWFTFINVPNGVDVKNHRDYVIQ